MMHWRGLVLFLFLLPGIARRSIRIDDFQNTLANGLEVSAAARWALIPGGFGTRVLRHAHPQAGALRTGSKQNGRHPGYLGPHRVAPLFRFGTRRGKVALQAVSGPKEDHLPPQEVRSTSILFPTRCGSAVGVEEALIQMATGHPTAEVLATSPRTQEDGDLAAEVRDSAEEADAQVRGEIFAALAPQPPPGTTTSFESSFASAVIRWLRQEGFRSRLLRASTESCHDALFLVVRGAVGTVVIRLLATPRSSADVLPALCTAALADEFALRRQALVLLWEDQWVEHPKIVRSRLLAKLGRTTRLFARKTEARRIDAKTADDFLLKNHLWGTTKARYRYGLYDQHRELVAVASFSARWRVRRRGSEPRASHELIRYCSRCGEVVVGGITKLIAAFRRDASPDEIVTVIDRDWGDGSGWSSLGFRPLKRLPAVTFYIGPDGKRCHLGSGPNPHRRRLPAELAAGVESLRNSTEVERFLAVHGYYPVHDAGAERHLLALDKGGGL